MAQAHSSIRRYEIETLRLKMSLFFAISHCCRSISATVVLAHHSPLDFLEYRTGIVPERYERLVYIIRVGLQREISSFA